MFKSRFFSFWFIALALLATAILPHHVSASGITAQQYNWVIEFNFDTPNTYDGVLNIIIRTFYSDGTVDEKVTPFPIECSAEGTGTVTVVNGKAQFQNGGYLECDLPSIRSAILSVMPNAAINDLYDPFWAQTVSTIDVAAGSADNPVFWHPNLNVGLPYTSATNKAQVAIETDQFSTVSSFYTPSPNHQTVSNLRNWLEEHNQPICSVQFRVNGNATGLSTYNCPRSDAAIRFSSNATTIYVGYAPDTGETFNGTINLLKIDPQWGIID